MGKFEVFKGEDGQFYFRLKAANGEPILISEGYTTKQMCYKGIDSVKENASSNIEDLTDETSG